MPRAECYYEILGVSETASSDEIKKAYRNLALVWHPDKNQANAEEAHSKFQSILKAYETLSDSRERDWYDRHKDQILSDGDKSEESCLNLFQYFSSACYANFDDEEDGFYTIYREVFNVIAKEEEQASQLVTKLSSSKGKQVKKEQPTSYPTFGNSQSDYETIIRPFYAFWSGFYTNLTFDHLDKYNTTEAENRRVLRAMEKENKKVKEAARKERNANVRNLIEFVKKRDKRLKAHKLLVEQQNQLNREKTAEKQRLQREKCLKESAQYKPTAWEEMNDMEEQLRQLESQYEDQGNKRNRGACNVDGEGESDEAADGVPESEELIESKEEDEGEEDETFDVTYCPACNKEFSSIKTFQNHEASKKHKQNVAKLTKQLKEEESKCKR